MNQAIFLSYASQDTDVASRICQALRTAGLEVWFDKNELTGGDAWDQRIRKQIKECTLFIPIISANTNAREEGYFRLEWKLAVDRSHLMADHKSFFLPVIWGDLLEATAHVPDKFRERQWSRLHDDKSISDFASRVQKIVSTLDGVAPQTAPGNLTSSVEVNATSASDALPIAQLPLPDKPSIAVLAFDNMSGDPDQAYFADGIVEDIVTALSRFKQLFVIARNSSFTYKGKNVDVKQVGRELGVRYVLEGSVRKSGDRVRITGQLIDATTGAHLWADRFDGDLADIFDLQDQVTGNVVGAIMPHLEKAEIERARRKPTEILAAYDYYLHGLAVVDTMSLEANGEAQRLFYRAIELDPEFALAYALAAHCIVFRKVLGLMADPVKEAAEASRLTRRAIEFGNDDAVVLAFASFAQAYVIGDLDEADTTCVHALTLNTNVALAWAAGGLVKICLGDAETGIRQLANAMRLSPCDPHIHWWQHFTASGHFFLGRYEEAAKWEERALRYFPDVPTCLRLQAASLAMAGRINESQKIMLRLLQLAPTLRISNLGEALAIYRRPQDIAKYVEAMRKAGLPE